MNVKHDVRNYVFICVQCVAVTYTFCLKNNKWHVMVVFLHAQTCINRNVHMKYNVDDLNENYYLNESIKMHLKMY